MQRSGASGLEGDGSPHSPTDPDLLGGGQGTALEPWRRALQASSVSTSFGFLASWSLGPDDSMARPLSHCNYVDTQVNSDKTKLICELKRLSLVRISMTIEKLCL